MFVFFVLKACYFYKWMSFESSSYFKIRDLKIKHLCVFMDDFDEDACFCNRLLVERTLWYEADAGRKYLTCPRGKEGCGYSRWIEPPHEPRAVVVIQRLIRDKTKLQLQHEREMMKITEIHEVEVDVLKFEYENEISVLKEKHEAELTRLCDLFGGARCA